MQAARHEQRDVFLQVDKTPDFDVPVGGQMQFLFVRVIHFGQLASRAYGKTNRGLSKGRNATRVPGHHEQSIGQLCLPAHADRLVYDGRRLDQPAQGGTLLLHHVGRPVQSDHSD